MACPVPSYVVVSLIFSLVSLDLIWLVIFFFLNKCLATSCHLSAWRVKMYYYIVKKIIIVNQWGRFEFQKLISSLLITSRPAASVRSPGWRPYTVRLGRYHVFERLPIVSSDQHSVSNIRRHATENGTGWSEQRSCLSVVHGGLRVLVRVARLVRRAHRVGAVLRVTHHHAIRIQGLHFRGAFRPGRSAVAAG